MLLNPNKTPNLLNLLTLNEVLVEEVVVEDCDGEVINISKLIEEALEKLKHFSTVKALQC